MATTSLGRRLKRLETTLRSVSELGAERNSAMQSLALQHLSDDDLAAVQDIVEQGKQPAQYTARESEAVKALTSAFELEVQKAGYASVREFQRRCGVAES
jgi:hypothetical protein